MSRYDINMVIRQDFYNIHMLSLMTRIAIKKIAESLRVLRNRRMIVI